jgi:UDP-N-acetylmuramoyl-L-alanyl-D-glutamate--2,6-diaminopimelate ligase
MAEKSRTMTFTLAQLLPAIELTKAADICVGGLSLDSRKIQTGDVFIALAGAQVDGRSFIASAIERGAAAILVDADKEWQGLSWLGDVPVIAVEQLPLLVSAIAARFYQTPSARMAVTGITGTNGKTTCSLLLGQICALLRGRGAVMGTVGCGVLESTSLAPLAQQIDALQTTGLTTPDPIVVQRLLAQVHEQGAPFVAMEVSSHSLVQARVAAVQFDCAMFTNLTQDHLDYHGDLASYGKAKQQLLFMPGLRYAVINADDTWAKSLLAQTPASVQALSYSISDSSADVYAKNVQLTSAGVMAELVTPWGEAELHSHFLGKFNLSNVLAVITAACLQGLVFADVIKTITQLQPAPGRMQAVVIEQSEQDIGVIVDYAHTPDALENTLNALHEHKPGRVWVVFGCGGDRDKTKRPLMGRIAERLSDYVIVTNDNPRSEDPAIIAAEILRGMHNTHGCLVIADRAQAIDLAVQQAKAGDLVLIAGKGHEDYQIFASQTLPFSDVKQARLSLQRRLAKLDSAEVQA